MTTTTTRRITCRYICRDGNRCTAEVLDTDPDAEIQICAKHAARVLELIQRRAGSR